MQKKHADFRRKRKFHARKLNGQQEPGAVERKGWPAGAPPFVLKRAQALASLVVTDQLRLSNDPYSYQRLRDFKIHIYERKRHSGALFQDKENPTKHQLPAVSSTPNLRASNSYRRHDQLRWFIDRPTNDWALALHFAARDCHEEYEEAKRLGTDSAIAFAQGFKFEEVNNTVERRLKLKGKKLRERKKPGRKPIGERAMTTAERVRKHRAKFNACPARPCLQPGPPHPPSTRFSAPPLGQCAGRLLSTLIYATCCNTAGKSLALSKDSKAETDLQSAGLIAPHSWGENF
jgi:hypothetical protein